MLLTNFIHPLNYHSFLLHPVSPSFGLGVSASSPPLPPLHQVRAMACLSGGASSVGLSPSGRLGRSLRLGCPGRQPLLPAPLSQRTCAPSSSGRPTRWRPPT